MPTSFSDIHGELNGQAARIFTLRSASGLQAKISELGAHLTSVIWTNGDGSQQELTIGHDSFEGWANNSAAYLGASVGRFGNRIAHGAFSIGHTRYPLATNNDPAGIPCHLHGGPEGFHTKIWQGELLTEENRHGVRLKLTSPDGEEGYPGNLDVTVTYWLSDDNELGWHAEATTDKPTPVNLVNHTYWNLSGHLDSPVTDHQIQIHADYFLPTNAGMIPTGEIRSVTDTPMDFTRPQLIGKGIDADYEPIRLAGGYDHCWVLRSYHDDNSESHPAAVVHHPGSGRTLEVLTNQPGVQFYTGNFLSAPFHHRSGLCLETEGFPDAPNHPQFPSAILHPGETYKHDLIWRFA
ncbi:MAG: galactose mutarotase [Akkermansiaceae bacterium]|nr:galactose mutarotase [Akkermansiaceae bacterium]